jgi:hypothetical protein
VDYGKSLDGVWGVLNGDDGVDGDDYDDDDDGDGGVGQAAGHATFSLHCSYMQLYNDNEHIAYVSNYCQLACVSNHRRLAGIS